MCPEHDVGLGTGHAALGHVYRHAGKRGPVWRTQHRLPAGRQVHSVGPAQTERGRPAAGYFAKRTAEAWLCNLLDQAARGVLPAWCSRA